MAEMPMETLESQADGCQNCAHTAKRAKEHEEIAMAFLLALIPVITLTFFGQVGLL